MNISEQTWEVIVHDLRHLGVKHRIKKPAIQKHGRPGIKVFKVPLINLELQTTTLKYGLEVEVPSFIVMACEKVRQEGMEIEGIFRLAGSAARQRELRVYLDKGNKLSADHNVIDVVSLMKQFFRDLPEPLIPYQFHDMLLRCMSLKDARIEALQMTCLLFPRLNLCTLAYLLQSLSDVAAGAGVHKMDASNLALMIAPNIMPVDDKTVINSTSRIAQHSELVQLLIENADLIGCIPESIREKVPGKRRSGSLTRTAMKILHHPSGMLNGLKKMVGKGGTPEVDENYLIASTPDVSTPCVKSSKKRKAEASSGFSSRKKRDVLQMLPQSVALATPYTPSRSTAQDMYIKSPVCAHPNPHRKSKSPQSIVKIRHRRFFTPKVHSDSTSNKVSGKDALESCKKSRLNIGYRSGKKQRPEELAGISNPQSSDVSSHMEFATQEETPDRSWNTDHWGRKKYLNLSDIPSYSPCIGKGVDINSDGETPLKGNSSANTLFQETHFDLSNNVIHVSEQSGCESMETEFVRIPKSEYEAIKNRVSAIENRISQEFGNIGAGNQIITNSVESFDVSCKNEVSNNNAELVQSAYEKTLEESEKLDDSSSDQLAKRLSKELRIRRSLEHKIIRSPSARKIGTIRRRSRENSKSQLKKPERKEVTRNMSWHLAIRPSASQISQLYPRSSLRRGRPNTVFSGLPQPNPRSIINDETTRITLKYENENVKSNEMVHAASIGDGINLTDLSEYLALCKDSEGPLTRSKAQRASSFHGCEWAYHNHNFINDCFIEVKQLNNQSDVSKSKVTSKLENNTQENKTVPNNNGNEHWQTAESFFKSPQEGKQDVPATGRASIAKLRSQNAGMVMERMKMFDPKVSSKLELSDKKRAATDFKSKIPIHAPGVFARNTDATQSLRRQSRNNQSQKHTTSRYQNQNVQKVHSVTRPRNNIGLRNVQNAFKDSPKKAQQRINSPMTSKLGGRNVQESFKDSPKKLGTPRKKQTKSPNCSSRRQKLKIIKSPSRVDPCPSPVNSLRRKHNSMKMARDKITTIKANLTAPDHWLSTDKENVLSPSESAFTQSNQKTQANRYMKDDHQPQTTLNPTIKDICSPAFEKSGKITPLKDSNRIRINYQTPSMSGKEVPMETSIGYRTPGQTPYIKKALLTKSPSQFTRTPKSAFASTEKNGRYQQHPMRAVTNFACGSPVGSPKRQSPRLLLLKSRNIS
ncbi:hypothetical protein C0J52_08407 [Blattella germanica]|nr:hypothetical protein C0J52_08407 [Blattella germanica]